MSRFYAQHRRDMAALVAAAAKARLARGEMWYQRGHARPVPIGPRYYAVADEPVDPEWGGQIRTDDFATPERAAAALGASYNGTVYTDCALQVGWAEGGRFIWDERLDGDVDF